MIRPTARYSSAAATMAKQVFLFQELAVAKTQLKAGTTMSRRVCLVFMTPTALMTVPGEKPPSEDSEAQF